MSAMASGRPLYLHIGLQKTGTSYLQSIFWKNQAELARQGLDMVPGSKRSTFHFMLRVRDRFRPEFDPPQVASALEAFTSALASATGSRALVSEESLAPASPEQIATLLAACGDREVHVVVTVRDLGRQIPSAWQQELQSGGVVGLEAYLRRLVRTEGSADNKLWSSKDIPAVLERWARFVPAERIHVVTVPPPGSDPELLLRRFCQVLDVDVDRLDRDVERSNQGLGRVQAEVLRTVNSHLPKEFRTRDVYGDIGKRYLAVQVLGAQSGEKSLVPLRLQPWCREVSDRYIKAIREGGYQVVGDLEDLVPPASAFAPKSEMAVDPADVADRAAEALAAMLVEKMTRLRERRARPRRRPVAAARGWRRLIGS